MARSTLSRAEARRRYREIGALAVLEQIRGDALRLDSEEFAIGPFARLDADAVAGRDGKTRGAITNVFGSQAAFQAETMDAAMDATGWIEDLTYPDPAAHATSDDWIDAFLVAQADRGPQKGTAPAATYAGLWAVWLAIIPYGIWSERVATPSMAEFLLWTRKLAGVFEAALAHFGLTLRDDVTELDLAVSMANLIEGAWINQCLSSTNAARPDEPVTAALRRGGRLLWNGAVKPGATRPPVGT